MRKALSILTVAATAAIAVPASTQAATYGTDRTAAAAVTTGAVTGTVIGLGVSEGWWGATAAGAALPTTVAGAVAVGGVAGVGTMALIDAVVQPCRGFSALFGMNKGACVNGQYVGYQPRVIRR